MATYTPNNLLVEEFLSQESQKDMLRFSTAGSVDDGKSTLIGRLLYDTQSVYEDQVRSIEGKGTTAPGQIDFALLTDGLRAEREQGITIDVAYRYFSTARRKFIIADTPGHEQYTRNMATGASTADAAVVLIDASKGVLIQSRRHAFIASLLRVRNVVVAVNKMDLIAYDEVRYRAIEREFAQLLDQIAADTGNPVVASFIPVSALAGDNVVQRSLNMAWYQGPSLLESLEALPASGEACDEAFRFPVQRVLRPDHTFRGFAGQIAAGVVRPGDRLIALPSRKSAVVNRIVTYDGDLAEAQAPLSVTLVLDREIDVSRGDLLVAEHQPALVAKIMSAALVWMDQRSLSLHRRYLLKHTSQVVPVFVSAIEHRTNIATLSHEAATTLEMNGIGVVTLSLLRPIAVDLYRDSRGTGAFILIDAETNSTVAAGMITAASEGVSDKHFEGNAWGRVTAAEREARWGHCGAVLELTGTGELVDAVERSLFSVGVVSNRIEAGDEAFLLHPNLLPIVTQLGVDSGQIVLVIHRSEGLVFRARIAGRELLLEVNHPNQAITAVHRLLHDTEIFIPSEKAGL